MKIRKVKPIEKGTALIKSMKTITFTKTWPITNKAGGLKNVDIRNKVIALQCSWIIRFYDDSFHESYERFYDDHFHDPAILKNHLALLLNIIQVYSLKVVKPNFSHFFIGKLF